MGIGRTEEFRSEAAQTIHRRDQDVLKTPSLQVIHDAQPELGPLGLLDPHPQYLLVAVAGVTDGEIDRLVFDQPFVTDLHPHRIEVDDGIDRLQRPRLPGRQFVENGIGDLGDQFRGDLDAVEFPHVTFAASVRLMPSYAAAKAKSRRTWRGSRLRLAKFRSARLS